MTRLVSARRSSATPEEEAAFVDAAFAAFEQAWSGDEAFLQVAGRTVRVRYAGLLDRFAPTLQHLAVAPSVPDLTVCCWDGASSPVALPAPPWRRIDFIGEARIRGHITGPLVATYDPDGRLFQLHDRPGRRALFHVADGADLPGWHDRSPFRPFVSRWADDRGLALLHGATVAESGAGLVLAGTSGSGKSTTALTCLLAGMDFLGDDACLVDGTTVWSLYGRAKLEPDAVGRFGDLTRLGPVARDFRGATLVAPEHVVRSAALRSVLLVRVGATTSVSERIPAEEAVPALMETLRVENKGLTRAAVDALEALVAAVPVRRLTVGPDPGEVVAAVRGVLTR